MSKDLSDSSYVKCSETNINPEGHQNYGDEKPYNDYLELCTSDYDKISDSAVISESTKSDHEYWMPAEIQDPGCPKPDYNLSDSQSEKPVQVVRPFQNETSSKNDTYIPETVSESLNQMEPYPQLPERKLMKSRRSKRPLLISCFFFFWIIITASIVTVVVIYVNNKDTPKASENTGLSSTGVIKTTSSKLTGTNTTPMTTNTSTTGTTTKTTLTIQTTTEKTLIKTTTLSSTKETTTLMTTTPITEMTTTTSVSDISTVDKYRDCKELYQQGYTTTGVYTIYPYLPVTRSLEVYCDMMTDGGGWTVFQHRKDGSLDFYLEWVNYKSGFGQPRGEHWLGNDHLHQLTMLGTSDFYVRLEKFSGGWYYAKYKEFVIANETEGYRMRLKIGSYQGTAGDSIESHGTTNTNGYKFSTYDVDNDFAPSSCAVARKGAWWHNICTWANLNGIYGNGSCKIAGNCNFWYSLTNSYSGVKTSFMMVRRN